MLPSVVSGELLMNRPLGVTILAVLAFINGVLSILGGLFLSGMAGAATAQGSAGAGSAVMAVGIVSIVLGVLYLICGFGLWTLKPWAWTLAIVVNILALLAAAYSIFGQQQYSAVI